MPTAAGVCETLNLSDLIVPCRKLLRSAMYQPQNLHLQVRKHYIAGGNRHQRGWLLTRSSGNVEIARFGDRRAMTLAKIPLHLTFCPSLISLLRRWVQPSR